MSKGEKIFFGGLGGITPVVLTVILADTNVLAQHIQQVYEGVQGSIYWAGGYAVKVVGLFIVGAVWALFHAQETSVARVYQMGLVAPATIMAMVNASNVESFRGPSEPGAVSGLAIIGTAHAQARPAPAPPPRPRPTPTDSFIRGLLGR